jgi:zinc protease
MGPAVTVQEATLDNGLKVVLHPDRGLSQVAVCATYAAGMRHAGPPGVAAVAFRMLQEGGRSTSGADYSRKVEARGGSIDNTLTADYAQYCTLVPRHEVELALWLEAGRMTQYAFNLPNFQKRIEELKGAYLDSTHASVYARGLRRLTEIAYQGHGSYERVYPPDPSDVERLSLGDVSAFHQSYYRSNNAVLSVAGDIDAFEVLDLVKRHLGSPGLSGSSPSEPVITSLSRQTSPRFSLIIEPTAKASAAYYGWVTAGANADDRAPLSVLSALLGDGEASLLHHELVQRRRLVSAVHCWTGGYAGPDLFALRLEANQGARLDVIDKGIAGVLTKLVHGAPVAPGLLSAAKLRVVQRYLAKLSSNLGKAAYIGERELIAGAADQISDELRRVEQVTSADLRRVVRTHLELQRVTSIEIYPKDWHDPNQAAMPRFHVVSSGENLTTIAKRYASTVTAIAKMNGINQTKPIFPGQKLRVPRGVARSSKQADNRKSGSKTASSRPAKKQAIAYSVKRGDSLSTIAARHQISVAAMLRANRIDPKKPLQIGQRLAIPVP